PVEGTGRREIHVVDQSLDDKTPRRTRKSSGAAGDGSLFHTKEQARHNQRGFPDNVGEYLISIGRRERAGPGSCRGSRGAIYDMREVIFEFAEMRSVSCSVQLIENNQRE